MNCPSCSASVGVGQRFCKKCGASLSRCSGCGAELDRKDRFCRKCGATSSPPGTSRGRAGGVGEDSGSRPAADAGQGTTAAPEPQDGAARTPRQKRWAGYFYRAVGVVLLIVAVGVWGETRNSIRRPGRSVSPVVVIVGIIAAGAGSWLFKRGKQHIAPTADEILATDQRPPVLYLRSFGDDEAGSKQYGGRGSVLAISSEEEQIADVMNDLGPFVGIGRPGDQLPELGAARTYVPDEQWQDKVLELMRRARLVVFRAGATEGLWWEIAEAARRLRPEQILFLVPFGGDEYEAFRQRASGVLRHQLPDHPGAIKKAGSLDGLIYFDPGWRPHFSTFVSRWFRTSSLKPISSMMRRSLQPVFEAHGVPYEKPTVNWWVVYLTFIITSGVVTLAGVLLALAMGWIEP